MKSNQKHYIAMAGLIGYMPQYSYAHDTYQGAVDDMAQLHELGRDRTRELKRLGYLSLNPLYDGNEYCEITECDCNTPEDHDDDNFPAY